MKQHAKVRNMTQLALLSAIILVMAFTPLGYLYIGPLSISFLVVPVAVGAVMMGPAGGAFLGLVFGLTSFWQAMQGASAFGALIFSTSPVLCFGQCVLVRVLVGFLAGSLFKVLSKSGKTRSWAIPAACLATPVLNTLLFMSYLAVFFGNVAATTYGFSGNGSLLLFLFGCVSVNALAEAVACLAVGTAVCKALHQAFPQLKVSRA